MKRALRGARCLRGRRPSSLGLGRVIGGGVAAAFVRPVDSSTLSAYRTQSVSFDMLEMMEDECEEEDGTYVPGQANVSLPCLLN